MAGENVTLEEQIVVSANEAIKALNDIKKSVKGVKNETSTAGSLIKKGLATIGTAFSLGKTINFLKDANKSAMDLVETANLFEVSMGKGVEGLTQYYEKAIKFQNELSEKLGTNINESMNYQALFNSMGTSMGLDRAVAYRISENFTKLGYDLASLYNTETDKAMQKLQSGLSGSSTRPLRAFGIDITQNTLANTLSNLGIERTISDLSQAEKMVLRYIAVLQQSSIAHGDFARTLESPANQLRIFQAQCLAFKQNIGALWQGIYASWMPYINGILMAINAVIRAIGSLFGIKFNSSVKSASESLKVGAGGAGGIASGLKNASGSAKDLKEQLDLMPWDEIHNIELPKDSSSGGSGGSGGGGGGGVGGIDPALLKAMEDYDNMMDGIKNKATDIRDKIMDWLGFDKLINKETGEIEWKLREGYQKIKLIGDILAGIALGSIGLKLAKLFFTPKQLEALEKGLTGIEKLKLIAGAITLSIGAVTILGGIKENDLKRKLVGILEAGVGAGMMFGLKGGVIGLTVATELTLALSMAKWGFENFDKEAQKIYGHVEGLSIWEKIKVFMSAIGRGFFDELGKAFGKQNFVDDILNPWIANNADIIKKSMDIGINIIKGIGLGILSLTPATASVVLPKVFEIIGNKVNELKSKLFEIVDGIINNTLAKIEETKNAIALKFEMIKTDALTKIEELKTNALNKWNEFKEGVATKIEETKTNISTKFEEIKSNTLAKIEEIKTKGIEKWNNFKENISTKLTEIKKNVTDKFDEIKNGIKERIEWARDRVKEAIDKIKSFFSGEFKLNIKIPHFDIQYDTNGLVAQAFQKMGLPGLPKLDVQWYAGGGFPTTGELFMAGEAGPELIGTMNGRNAVANNTQIIEGIKAGVYEAVASAMSEYGGVQIQASIEEGILLKKVQNQAKQYRTQTGKVPFPTM